MLTEKQRLLAVLSQQPVDRPPVICPGGMMSLAIEDVMDLCGADWPAAHVSASAMVALALAMHEHGALENLAVPFCMTVEAEALGASINLGTRTVQPRVSAHPYGSARELSGITADTSGRLSVTLEAIRSLVAERPDVPTIGNLVGPVSLAASLVEPGTILREMRRAPDGVHAALDAMTRFLLSFGIAQRNAGAEVIAIAEPTATGRILGPRLFAKFAAPCLRRLVEGLHGAGAKVILHICGDMRAILPQLGEMGADAVSADEMVHLGRLRAAIAPTPVMGNLSAFVLEAGPQCRIERWCRGPGLRMADIIAPACGVVPSTPLSHVRAFSDAVRE